MSIAVHHFASLGAGVQCTTTSKVTLTLDPKRAYRLAKSYGKRKSGAAAANFQLTISTTSGLANAAAALTDDADGYVAQTAAAGAPGTAQRYFATSADQRWFVPNASGEAYLYMFPDVSGDYFVYRVMLESVPLAK